MKKPDHSSSDWKRGDRVRVVQPQSPYTGCRGTIVEDSGSQASDQLPLGYYVAIDGENGIAQPFLTAALERIGAVSSRGLRQRREPGRDAQSGDPSER